jgi:hypothetical protein
VLPWNYDEYEVNLLWNFRERRVSPNPEHLSGVRIDRIKGTLEFPSYQIAEQHAAGFGGIA